MQVTYALGHCMLRAAGKEMDYTQAVEMFQKAITSGQALEVFRRFIAAQGGDAKVCDDYSLLPASSQQVEFMATASGYISRINSFEVGMAAIDTGAGRRKKEDAIAYGSGFVFHANVGDRIEKGGALVTVHSDRPEKIPAVLERLGAAIQFSQDAVARPKMVLHLVDKEGVKPWPY
jgi:pyrimidine-nucleoside phosphorylase